MDWENFWAVVDKGVRIFSVAGVAIINFASGIYVGIQFLPYDKIKDGQNAGSNNAGKS